MLAKIGRHVAYAQPAVRLTTVFVRTADRRERRHVALGPRAVLALEIGRRAIGMIVERQKQVAVERRQIGTQLDSAFFAQEHPDLLVLRLQGPDATRLVEPIPAYADGPVGDSGRVYLVDPLGNLLMSYPASAPDKALLTDVKKLLRLSHIG